MVSYPAEVAEASPPNLLVVLNPELPKLVLSFSLSPADICNVQSRALLSSTIELFSFALTSWVHLAVFAIRQSGEEMV